LVGFFLCIMAGLVMTCVCVCVCEQEQTDLRSALTALGMVSSPAAEQIHRVRSAVASAMAADSHQRLATSGLHPSPSMPEAVYSPLRYDGRASQAGL
jgi:hypothetical protein